MKALFGKKIGMIQASTPDGTVMAVTLVEVNPMTVTQVKTVESDGYDAVQFGFGNNKKLSKPLEGHLKTSKLTAGKVKESRESGSEKVVGDKVDVEIFSVGDKVNVSANSKGKGFAGTVKRHNFDTGPKSHGSMNYRKPGSIGSMYPQNVMKGKRMAGQMGGTRVTTKNLEVAIIDKPRNVIGLIGSIPGPANGLVEIRGVK
jgi:large subunit ribosomal protein L3